MNSLNVLISLQYAMHAEAMPMIQVLKAQPITSLKSVFPFEFYYAEEFNLLIACTGKDSRFGVDAIGTIPAALLANAVFSNFQPRLHLNAGTAGGFEQYGAQIGEVYLGSPVVCFHSRNIELPGFLEMGLGHFKTFIPKSLTKLNLPLGIVSTGDSLNFTDEDQTIMKKTGATIKEMEAASIAWVCEKYGVPFLPIKAITDFVDHHETSADQFFKNLELATQNLTKKMCEILKLLKTAT